MKKYFFGLIFISQFLFAQNALAPVLGMRFNLDNTAVINQVVGVQINFGDGKYSGFDTDGQYSRIFMGMSYAKLGIGTHTPADGATSTEVTVGATYNILGVLNTDIEYVYKPEDVNGSGLRVALGLQF